MGVRGYSSTVIVTGIILTPLVAIIKDGWPLGVIFLWIICGYLAIKSNIEVENSPYTLARKYNSNPEKYLLPDFIRKMGVVDWVPKKGIVEIPAVYQRDRYIALATQHVSLFGLQHDGVEITKYRYKAIVDHLAPGGAYKVDNYGIYREGRSSVGEISKEDEESICGFGRDLKRIYVLMLSKVDGKLIVQPPHWQNEKTTAEFSKFYNYYDGYKYDSKTKKCYKINMPLVTDENNKCPKAADADYRRYRRE